MDKKIKMLVIQTDKIGGVGFFRSKQPHEYIAKHYSDEFEIDIITEFPKDITLDKFFSQYDIVQLHKQLDPNCELINLMKFCGCKVVVDIDDHYELGNDHPLSFQSKKENWKEPIIKHLQAADLVSTTTEIFKKTLLKHNKNVAVFANAINPEDEQFIPKPTESKRLRFGIICGSSHLEDMKLLNGLVQQLPQDILDKIQFVLCGFDTNGTRTFYYEATGKYETRPILPKETVWYEYEKILTNDYKTVSPQHKDFLHRFLPQVEYPNTNEAYRRCWTKPIDKYATHYNNIDVLLVPLKENIFNSAKSQLKVIESGFFNKAIIASNFGPYTIDLVSMIEKGGKVNENGNALLVDSTKNHKQWAKYVKMLANDRELLEKLKTNLHNTVKDKYSLETVAKQRVEAYKKLLNM
jgi:glycosyltransferase involved in cell wall biosynthesis